ncbi:gluconeogenesis factor YvcK family protein [Janibacter hoylei]|uniref:gluconeogenesis factor YvcK family protein n=1 Tax=Janibacter hoylei TaxID=364298 RepID=UPI0021A7CF65|nr:uridine diphosphate-N-acetylglucosamine-binding protein YvcK [Janibacter hoylei]MCT1618325.1 uridine diphosphate-N-acetylglucosamine-binding protein YvcK [Janibacter hoylei]MCT2293250.1 uridine diphosphate-N-acetylglucosamine-binding protein YvcK [Janibacter hoylei]
MVDSLRTSKVVALGGGHGLAASLSALRLVCDQVTAIVTVADNGGSSGRLRADYDVLPPGDLRMALTALCDDSEWGQTWSDVLQHRFTGDGDLSGHALGNLLIVALWQLHEDPVTGLDLVGRLLSARGRVLPMAAVPLELVAEVSGLDATNPTVATTVRGQVEVARTQGLVESISLEPDNPPARPESVAAVDAADHIVLGPGSWYTSVLTHLLVPELRDALVRARARKVLTLNLEMHTAETRGFSATRHIETLHDLAPELRFDTVLADPLTIEDRHRLTDACERLGAELVVAPLARLDHRGQHDALRLAAAYRDILS